MGWTEGFEPSISRATTWRLNHSATPTTEEMPETCPQTEKQPDHHRRLECITGAQIGSRKGPRKAAILDLIRHVKMAPSFNHIDGIEYTGPACSLDLKGGPDGALYFSTTDTIYRWGS